MHITDLWMGRVLTQVSSRFQASGKLGQARWGQVSLIQVYPTQSWRHRHSDISIRHSDIFRHQYRGGGPQNPDRDSVTRFFASGSFHESVSPQPQSILLRPFRIFSKIRGDIPSSRFATSVNNTGGKWKKSSIRKIVILLFGHLWKVEETYI